LCGLCCLIREKAARENLLLNQPAFRLYL
jgi:hypothetical protein